MLRNATCLFAIGAGCLFVAAAQDQPSYVRDACIKVAPAKTAEYQAFSRDVTAKLMKVRMADGHLGFWVVASASVPSGTAARCDYHVVTFHNGFPPETPTTEQIAADLKKAGVNMTGAEFMAKRSSLTTLVNVDIWQARANVGPAIEKGHYLRLNYYHIKPGQQAAWLKLETTGWMPFVESMKDSHVGWHLNTLTMPGGEYLHYNALTVDDFPSWDALGKGVPTATAWPKAHPDMPFTDYMNLIGNTAERYRVDVVRVEEAGRP